VVELNKLETLTLILFILVSILAPVFSIQLAKANGGPYSLTVNVGAHGSSNQTGESVDWGTTVGFLFTPDTGYHVSDVLVNGSSVGAITTLSVLVEGPTTVDVSFAINTYSLTVNVGADGMSNQSSTTVDWGITVGFLFIPNAGYHISDVKVNGSSVGTANSLSILIEGPTTIDISFAINNYGLTVNVGAHGSSNQTSETVNWGTTVGFLFTPDTGYHIADVKVNGTSVGAVSTLNIIVEGPTTIDVSFGINTFNLTVNVGAHGSSNQTTETVDWGTSVGLAFTPDAGYHISDVTVNGTSAGTASNLEVLVEGPTTVDVSFAINTYSLTVTVGAHGASNQTTEMVDWGTTVGFLFAPDTGYHISDVKVNGSSVGTESTLSILVNGPTTVDVSFAINTYSLTVNVGAHGLSNQSSTTVDWGTSVGFLFTPDTGYHVSDVLVNGSSVGAVSTFGVLVEGPTTVDVSFAIDTYSLTVNVGANGMSNQSSTTVDWGITVGFLFTPDTGYHISDVKVNGSSIGAVTTLSILVEGPTTIDVSFAINTYNLTVNVGAHGTSNQTTETVDWGTHVGFLFMPNTGYHISTVTVNGSLVGTASTLEVLVEGPTTVDVSFAINTYAVTVNVGAYGSSNQSSETVNWGTTVGFGFTPATGYHISDVKVNGTSVGTVTTLSVLVEGPTTVDVIFAINTYNLTVNVGAHGSSNQTTEMVAWGSSVGFLFTPNTGYHVSAVLVNGSSVGTASTLKVLVEGPTTVDVSFAINTYSLTVSVGTNGVSNQSSEIVAWGSSVGFLFTPDTGYHVSDVLVNGSSVGPVTTLTALVEGSTTVDVSFAINTYSLTVNVGANGASNQTTETVDWGTLVGFLFTPDDGYHISDVLVNGSSVGTVSTLEVLVEGPTTVNVSFAINVYSLIVNVGANGASNQTTETVDWGSNVGFLFTPNSGYHISDVSVNGTSVGAVSTLSVLVKGPTSVNVTFSINTYSLTVNVGAHGVSNQSSTTVDWGTLVGFIFTPNIGYHISDVKVNGTSVGTTSTLSVLVEGPTTIDVSFAINTYSLTVNVGANGASNQSSEMVVWGSSVGFLFTPSVGYHVSDVLVNGSSVGAVTTLSELVEGSTTVDVSFAINTCSLTVNVGAHGLSNQSSTTVDWGTSVGFLFTSDTGYHISSVTVNGSSVGVVTTLSVLVEGPTTVGVSFAINTYILTVNVGADGVSNQSSTTVNWGSSVGFLFTPATGYHISDVKVNGSSIGTGTTLEVLVEGPTTVDASFAINTYTVTFTETGLPAGTAWNVTFNGETVSSTGSQIVLANVTSGAYSWSMGTPVLGSSGTRYVASPQSGSMSVPTQTIQSIAFTKQYYLSVTSNSGTVTPVSGWFDAGFNVTISASETNSSGERFLWKGWIGTGGASYSGMDNPSWVVMNGSLSEAASWTSQYSATFDQDGLDATATGTVVTVNNTAYTYMGLPFSVWVNSGEVLVFNYANVSSTASDMQFVVYSVSAHSPLTVLSSVTVVGYYKTELLTMQLEGTKGWYWTQNTTVTCTVEGDLYGNGVQEIVTGGYYFDGVRDVAQLVIWNGSNRAVLGVTVWYWYGDTTINSVAIGDVYGNGSIEIVTGGYYFDGVRDVAQLVIWDAKTLAVRQVKVWTWGDNTAINSLAISDLYGDGHMEIVTGGYYFDGVRDVAQLVIWDAKTLAVRQVKVWTWGDNTTITSLAVGDVDGDGHMEIVTGGYYFDGTHDAAQLVVWNSTLAVMQLKVWSWSGNTIINSVAIGDVYGNGSIEIVTGGYYFDGVRDVAQLVIWNGSNLTVDNVKVWYWNGDTAINSVAISDVDGDGHMEIVTGGYYFDGTRDAAQLVVWDGSTLTVKQIAVWFGGGNTIIHCVMVGDLNGDGILEIVTGGNYYDGIRNIAQLTVWTAAYS
jgi:hypothetical protein